MLLAILLLALAVALAGCDAAPGSSGERVRLSITPVPSPTPTAPAQPTAAPVKYTVQPGDTLSGIAATFGVTVDDIVRVNNIADPNSLSVGQVLTIPGRAPEPPPSIDVTPGATVIGTLETQPVGTGTPPASPTPVLPPPDATPPQGPPVPETPEAVAPQETSLEAPTVAEPEQPAAFTGEAPGVPPAPEPELLSISPPEQASDAGISATPTSGP